MFSANLVSIVLAFIEAYIVGFFTFLGIAGLAVSRFATPPNVNNGIQESIFSKERTVELCLVAGSILCLFLVITYCIIYNVSFYELMMWSLIGFISSVAATWDLTWDLIKDLYKDYRQTLKNQNTSELEYGLKRVSFPSLLLGYLVIVGWLSVFFGPITAIFLWLVKEKI